jgi:hypothetical protein
MTLLNLLNSMVVSLDALIRATTDPFQQAQLTKLRDAFDAMSDQAVNQLFDQNSVDYAAAVSALNQASADATAGTAAVAKVATAINSAVAAANAADKILGFLAHLT